MDGTRVPITGAGGQLALPVALDLARTNDVWAVARFSNPVVRERLVTER